LQIVSNAKLHSHGVEFQARFNLALPTAHVFRRSSGAPMPMTRVWHGLSERYASMRAFVPTF
jgi:hypothetical protein